MKNIFLIAFTLLLIGVFLTVHPAFAGEGIEFPVETPVELVHEAIAEKNTWDDPRM